MPNNGFTPCWRGEVFLTGPDVGWVVKQVGNELKSVAVKPPKEDAVKPVTSLYKTTIAQRTYAKRHPKQVKGLISQPSAILVGN